jgi:hypothetical protein
MIPAIYTAIGTIIVAVLSVGGAGLFSRKRGNISGAKEITESALLLVAPQTSQIKSLITSVNELSASIEQLRCKVSGLERHIDVLTNQLISLGHTPARLETLEEQHGRY